MARLFLPGPTDVDPQVLQAQAQPMIGHRGAACVALIERIEAKLKPVFGTEQRVFILASSGTGLQEAAMRNCVGERVLVAVCGAFGERWFNVAQQNGIPADRLDAEWGSAHDPADIAAALQAGDYDALAVVHNETSTGVENPIAGIASAAHEVNPDLLVLVDAVSSAGGVELRVDEWGLDVVLTSSQKCFALPPGLAFAAVSDRALARAETVPHRGWYFDFLLLERYLQRGMTPATPAISLLYALDLQLDRMLAEGLPQRFARHAQMASFAQGWAQERFALFAKEGSRSKTVTAIRMDGAFDVQALNDYLQRENMTVAGGYGPLKESTFRIGHMGEVQLEDLERLTALIDAFLDERS